MSDRVLTVRVNGVDHALDADEMTSLADVLRDELGRLEVKVGCRVADAVPRPCLFGALLTVSAAHADVRIDVPLLRAAYGVTAVLGPQHAPAARYSGNVHGGAEDTQVFTARSRFAGDVVGAVAATSRRALRQALDLAAATGIRCNERPAVLDLETAEAGRILANDRYPGNRIADVSVGLPEAEIERLLATAPLRHGTRVEIEPAPHGFLEPVACGAQWLPDRVRVWSCSQGPQVVRDRLAALFGHPAEVITPFIGGGFGGKEEYFLEPVAALLSRASGGHPVLIELDREQCTRRFRLRHGGVITIETGFTPAGSLLARRARIVLEAGPYDGHSAGVAGNTAGALLRLYPSLPTCVDTVTLATNRVPGGAFRAYGSELASMAMETHLDEVAAIAGCDPIALRLMNCAREHDADPVQGGPLPRPRARACLETLRHVAAAWEADTANGAAVRECRPPGRFRRGRGVALMVGTAPSGTKTVPATSEVRADFDAAAQTLTLFTGVPELGQGIVDLLTAVAAAATKIDPDRIDVRCTSDPQGPADLGMFGNRGATLTATAAHQAIIGLERDIAAAHRADNEPREAIQLLAGWRGIRRADLEFPVTPRTWSHTAAASTADARAGVAYGAALAEVEVDTATGIVTVLRVHAVHDVGKLLRPGGALGQVEGGLVQAIGIALSERAAFDTSGTPDVRGFFSHLVPTINVAPRLGVTWLEDTASETPLPKGLGENTVAALPAAIANAVRAATGAEVRAFPLSPPLVLDAIDAVRSFSPDIVTGPVMSHSS
jgi:CO/xanthine dehydrogenase Mo-binding subunit